MFNLSDATSFNWGVIVGIVYGLALSVYGMMFLITHPEIAITLYTFLQKTLFTETKLQDKTELKKGENKNA
jgi:hypothetical protein